MLTNYATLKQIGAKLTRELLNIYPEGESKSITSLVLQHVGFSPSFLLMHPDTCPDAQILVQINEILKEIH